MTRLYNMLYGRSRLCVCSALICLLGLLLAGCGEPQTAPHASRGVHLEARRALDSISALAYDRPGNFLPTSDSLLALAIASQDDSLEAVLYRYRTLAAYFNSNHALYRESLHKMDSMPELATYPDHKSYRMVHLYYVGIEAADRKDLPRMLEACYSALCAYDHIPRPLSLQDSTIYIGVTELMTQAYIMAGQTDSIDKYSALSYRTILDNPHLQSKYIPSTLCRATAYLGVGNQAMSDDMYEQAATFAVKQGEEQAHPIMYLQAQLGVLAVQYRKKDFEALSATARYIIDHEAEILGEGSRICRYSAHVYLGRMYTDLGKLDLARQHLGIAEEYSKGIHYQRMNSSALPSSWLSLSIAQRNRALVARDIKRTLEGIEADRGGIMHTPPVFIHAFQKLKDGYLFLNDDTKAMAMQDSISALQEQMLADARSHAVTFRSFEEEQRQIANACKLRESQIQSQRERKSLSYALGALILLLIGSASLHLLQRCKAKRLQERIARKQEILRRIFERLTPPTLPSPSTSEAEVIDIVALDANDPAHEALVTKVEDTKPQASLNENLSTDNPSEGDISEELADYVLRRLHTFMEEQQGYRDSSLSLEMLCTIAGTNRSYLSRIINQYAQCSVPDYINLYRLREAKRLLLSTDMKHQVIALEVGFGSYQSFTRNFKKQEGVTPATYARVNRSTK